MEYQVWPLKSEHSPMSSNPAKPLYRVEAETAADALAQAHRWYRLDYGPIDREDFERKFSAFTAAERAHHNRMLARSRGLQ